jgi:hypothetical protein
MPFTPQFEGFERGEGRLHPKGSTESYDLDYDLTASSEVLDVPGRGQVPRKQRLEGTIDPVPEGVRLHVPHILELEDGRRVECWIRSASGKVMCQPLPGAN